MLSYLLLPSLLIQDDPRRRLQPGSGHRRLLHPLLAAHLVHPHVGHVGGEAVAAVDHEHVRGVEGERVQAVQVVGEGGGVAGDANTLSVQVWEETIGAKKCCGEMDLCSLPIVSIGVMVSRFSPPISSH